MLASDFGDAPAPYPTLVAELGAQHTTFGLTLGSQRDAETDGFHSIAADGDDVTGSPNDEDGITFGTVQVGALNATVDVTVTVTGGAGKLDAWIDFGGDGNWGGPGEQIFDSVDVVTGVNALTFDVPAGGRDGVTFARFRLSTAGGLGPGGLAIDGEVEDHTVTLVAPAASAGVFAPVNEISTTADGATRVVVADVDGDGDLDVLSASRSVRKIAWYENDGMQGFTERVISTNADFATSVVVGDVDGDGDLDVLSASSRDDKIAWYENDGSQGFTERVISNTADAAGSVVVGDVDGDGDLDVLSASLSDDKIAWYENINADFGDAPSPYPTQLSNNGPFHTPVGPTLGPNRDSESDGQPTATVDGDDNSGDNDEDGVLFGGITPGSDGAALNVDLQNAADARVDAWIDFNRNGSWDDPGEQILSNQPVISGLQTINYDMPTGVTAGTTFARVRVCSNGGLSPEGFSVDGEVEDYQITIGSPRVESVVINDGNAQRSSLDSIGVRFDREVMFIGDVVTAFQVVNQSTGVATPVQATVTIDPINDRTVVDLTFVPDGPSDPLITSLGSLTDGDYRLVVLSSMVNASGVGLEEDFVFGDGELSDVLFRKYGDDSGDESVGLTDFAAFRSTFGLDLGDTNYLRGLDANGDNTIGLTDFVAFGN